MRERMKKMESKHKNILIGALLAVVFVMAVGYAAFAQQLTINGSAEITSTWDVKYDSTKTEATPGVVEVVTGFAGGTTPKGTVSYDNDDHNANISATLYQPGDTVTFTLTIKNNGTIPATVGTPTVEMTGDQDVQPLVARKGNIQFTVTPAATTTMNQNDTVTMTVKAEFISGATSVGTTTSASITVNMNASQAQ